MNLCCCASERFALGAKRQRLVVGSRLNRFWTIAGFTVCASGPTFFELVGCDDHVAFFS